MSSRDINDRVIVGVLAIVGTFIVLSLVAQFILLWTGRADPNDAGVFRPLFDLVAVLVGALGGFVTGQTVERSKSKEE